MTIHTSFPQENPWFGILESQHDKSHDLKILPFQAVYDSSLLSLKILHHQICQPQEQRAIPAHAYCCGPSQPIAHLASGEVGRQERTWVSPMGSTVTDKKLGWGKSLGLGRSQARPRDKPPPPGTQSH